MKNGFTLIELLAVIVILAIIAVIATPIVLNIIKDTKKSSSLRSAENYKNAIELSISKEIMNSKNIEDGIYHIDGNNNLIYKNKILKLDIDNPNFNSGIVSIKNNKVEFINFIKGNTSYQNGIKKDIKVWDGTSKEPETDSDGSYLIYTPEELAWVAEQTDNGNTFEGNKVLLMDNLDLGGNIDSEGNGTGREWNSIGESATSMFFKGTFDGNNYIIKNMYIDKTDDNRYGLFSIVYYAVVKNLNIYNSYVKGNKYSGILAGTITHSTVENINIYNSYINGNNITGVISGNMVGSTATNINIYNSHVFGNYITGGVIGQSRSNFLNQLYSNTTVDSSESIESILATGGVVGIAENTTEGRINNLISDATVISTKNAGGVFGQIQSDTFSIEVDDVLSNAIVTGNNSIGGIVGILTGSQNEFKIKLNNLKSFAKVISENGYAGGVIGNISLCSNELTNIYSKANITGTTAVGGIIGGIANSNSITYYKNLKSESTISATSYDQILGYNNGGEFLEIN